MSFTAPSLVPIRHGGTGARSASEARTALGLSAAAVLELASQAEAEAGTLNTRLMTPLRVAQAIAALAGASSTKVTNATELAAALAIPGSNIVCTQSFTIASNIPISSGSYSISRSPGVQMTVNSGVTFTASSLVELLFVDPFWEDGAVFLITATSPFQNTANFMIRGALSMSIATAGGGLQSTNYVEMFGIRITSAVYSALQAVGKIDTIKFEGSNAANAYLYLRCSFDHLVMSGLFRPDNAGGNLSSNYSVAVVGPGYPWNIKGGEIAFKNHSQVPAVFLQGSTGRVSVDAVFSFNSSYIPTVGMAEGACVRGGQFKPVFLAHTNAGGTFRDCILNGNPRFESGSDSHVIDNCDISGGNWTFPADSRPIIKTSRVAAALVFQASSAPVLEDVTLASGSITLNAGANGQLTRLVISSGTLTNSDPGLSMITGCSIPSRDTTPATRRWQTSAGAALADLDAFSRKNLIAYFDFAEAPQSVLNKAPNGAPRAAAASSGCAAASSMPGGKGVTFGSVNERVEFSAYNLLPINTAAEFAISFNIKPSSLAPGGDRTILTNYQGAIAAGLVDLVFTDATNRMSLTVGGTTIAGSTALTTAIQNIVIQRRSVTGTPTYELYRDGVLEATTTADGTSAIPESWFWQLGYGAASFVGDYGNFSFWSRALPSARIAELAAGARLVGADL